MKKVVIIGAGASGLMAAQRAASLGAEVAVYEMLDAAGKKLSATGNGRCNYTNMSMSPKAYHMNEFYRCFRLFGNTDAVVFFKGIGIEPLVQGGNVYPRSEQAASVVRALVRRCESLGVDIIKNHRIDHIQDLYAAGMSREDSLILACGSKASVRSCNSYKLLEELGIPYKWVDPALCGICCSGDDDFFKAVSGVRCKGIINGEYGELQLTDYGISGIAAFNIAHDVASKLHLHTAIRHVHTYNTASCKNNAQPLLTVDFLPEFANETDAADFLEKRRTSLGLEIARLGDGFMNLKLWQALMKRISEKYSGHATMQIIAHELKCCEFVPYKMSGFDKCQVCSGGIGIDEIDPDTMELYRHPGIYAAGELIDMDGICGGYNLQWAWTSGYIAGTYAAGGMLSS